MLTQDPTPEITFSPQSVLRLYVILEYLFRVSHHGWPSSADPLHKAYFKLSMAFGVPENGLNSSIETAHHEINVLFLGDIGLSTGLNQFISA